MLSSSCDLDRDIIMLSPCDWCVFELGSSTRTSPRSLTRAGMHQTPKYPIKLKDAHTGTKRRLDDKMDNRDSGISGTGMHAL